MGRQSMSTKLTYLVSHPIQYQAPLLRQINKDKNISLRVVFEKKPKSNRFYDIEFRRQIKWDVKLTGGYYHVTLSDTELSAEIKNTDILWVHGWNSFNKVKALRIAKKLDMPVFMRGENSEISMPDGVGLRGWIKRRYINWVFSHCYAFLSIGAGNKNYYLNRGILDSQIFHMPYAVDNNFFKKGAKRAEPNREKLRETLGLAADKKVVLFAGKFLPRKKPDLLIAAMKELYTSQTKPALIFVGTGKMEKKLKRLAPEAVFLGFMNQTELPPLYDLADVFVLPSEREPWGLAVNEAMACGTSVIVSDQVGCGTDLLDESCGRIFPAGDRDTLAQ